MKKYGDQDIESGEWNADIDTKKAESDNVKGSSVWSSDW